jgi:intracellular septation protein A
MTEITFPTAGKLHYSYRRPFRVASHACEVILRSGVGGSVSELLIDGIVVARDFTPASGYEGARNHQLTVTLPDGRHLVVEAGYINWINIGIAAQVDGELVHESHPGRRIAMPERAAKMMASTGSAANYDPDVWQRNRIPLAIDIGLGLLFFVVAKLTDLTTAALVGAAAGVLLLLIQRLTKIDLLGGLAMFGIVLLLISAGLALLFQSDEAVKYRSTVMGLLTASLFLTDGLTRGKRLGVRLTRYLPYKDIDPPRLSVGMGMLGLIMAGGNQAVAMLASTDVWLFYSTFVDFILTMVLIYSVFRYARGEILRNWGPAYPAPVMQSGH